MRLCDPFGSKLVLPSIEGAISKYDIKLVVLLAHHSGLNAQPTDIDAAVVQCIADWPQESDPIRNAQESKSLIIVPARYNLHSGQVEFLGETAAQLLDSAELQLDWK